MKRGAGAMSELLCARVSDGMGKVAGLMTVADFSVLDLGLRVCGIRAMRTLKL